MIGFTHVDTGTGDRWVQYRLSTNNGTSFGSVQALATKAANDSSLLVLSVRAGVWRAVFGRCSADPCTEGLAMMLRKSSNAGSSWSTAQKVSTATTFRAVPVGADGGTKTVVCWMRQYGSGATLIVYARREA